MKRGIRTLSFLVMVGAAAVVVSTPANGYPAPPAGHRVAGTDPGPAEMKRKSRSIPTDRTSLRLGRTGPAFAPPPPARSTNGTIASVADHPYVVGLVNFYWEVIPSGGFQSRMSICSGTVLSPTKVLTAAHCTVNLPLGTTYVVAGRNDLFDQSSGFVTQPRSVYTHQQYDDVTGAPNNDVAVITVKDALPSDYTPIARSAQGDESWYADGTPAQIVGYGKSAATADDAGTLRVAAMPIRADNVCGLTGYRAATMACAGDPLAGIDMCDGDDGGPLVVTRDGVRTQVAVTSFNGNWNATPGWPQCGNSHGGYAPLSVFADAVRADLTRGDPGNLDWTGDGHSDLIVRTGSGALWLYGGSGYVADRFWVFTYGVAELGTGWDRYTKLFRTMSWNGDGRPSIMARAANGDLFQYRSDGAGEFATGNAERVGNGWNVFNDIMVTTNWSGDGRPNLIGRTPTGDLYLYTSDGNGGWTNGGTGIKIGNGWDIFDTILTPGTWLGDGRQALIGRTPSGALRLYQSNGNGGWVNGAGVQIGSGWNMFSRFMSPGDVNGDNFVDMIGLTPDGRLLLYRSDGRGNWLDGGTGRFLADGWTGLTALF